MVFDEIHKILRDHKKWLQSKGREGKRADLTGMNLKGRYLRGVNLRGAKLKRADLQRSDLEEADLRNADLEEANFQYANLRGADLRGTVLHGVDLQGADLIRTKLQDANIKYTNMKFIKIDRKTLSQIPEEMAKPIQNTWFILDFEHFISHSIEFPPEFLMAGTSILSFFGTVLRKKFPDIKAKIRLEQNECRLTLTIDPLEGEKNKIENALFEYGNIVSAKMSPDEFTDDKVFSTELKQEIHYAKLRIESQAKLARFLGKKDVNKKITFDRFLKIMAAAFAREE